MQRVPAERWALGYPHFERKMRWREYVSNLRNVRFMSSTFLYVFHLRERLVMARDDGTQHRRSSTGIVSNLA